MKKFKLSSQDLYDLSLVTSDIINTHSDDIDFKDIILAQKATREINQANDTFVSAVKKIHEERDELTKIAQKKIKSLEENLTKVFSSTDKEKIESGEKDFNRRKLVIDRAFSMQLNETIAPKIEKLTEKEVLVEVELSDDKHGVLVELFEKFAKGKYLKKDKMVETYETLTDAK